MNNISTRHCPHFDKCSGCELHLDELPPVWDSVLSFFAPFSIKPHLYTSKMRGWRLKAKLSIRGTPTDPLIGLFKKGTHETVSIPECLVHHPSINKAVQILRTLIQESKISIYNESNQIGTLRYLQFFVERSTGKVQLALVINAQSIDPALDSFCKKLSKNPLWHSIWLNFQPEKTNRVLGPSWQKLYGEEWLYQSLCGHKIAFHPGAFAQAHLELFEELIHLIQTWVPQNSHIVELFAGVGAIGLSLHAEKILLIENNPFAYLSFQAHPEIPPHCKYLIQDAAQFEDFASYDLLIVDPPRKGLGPELLQKLSQAKELQLIYVSCGWESFQKDTQYLIDSGWTLEKAEGFYLFPGTNHVEIVAYFEKERIDES